MAIKVRASLLDEVRGGRASCPASAQDRVSRRIHTSTGIVAVLPEVEEVEVDIDPNDLKVDVYRLDWAWGQSVNTNWIRQCRLTHLTSLVVTVQDEKSQLQNKEKAMRILRARLYQMESERQQSELAGARRSQVGSGERSEKIRTYNFGGESGHRPSPPTLKRLDQVLDGDLEEFVTALSADEQATRLAEGV